MRFSIICSANKPEVLNENLLKSPGIHEHDIIVVFGANNVPNAYNRAVKIATEEILIFVHQDVFLPEGFFGELEESISKLCSEQWGILGPIGVRLDESGNTVYMGDVVDRGNRLGKNDSLPEQIQTLDEMMLICKKEDAFFDEKIPTKHHMHGTDLCLNSISNGRKNFAVKAFCYHNCFSLSYELPDEFYLASEYVRNKWRSLLPVVTTCIRLDPLWQA